MRTREEDTLIKIRPEKSENEKKQDEASALYDTLYEQANKESRERLSEIIPDRGAFARLKNPNLDYVLEVLRDIQKYLNDNKRTKVLNGAFDHLAELMISTDTENYEERLQKAS